MSTWQIGESGHGTHHPLAVPWLLSWTWNQVMSCPLHSSRFVVSLRNTVNIKWLLIVEVWGKERKRKETKNMDKPIFPFWNHGWTAWGNWATSPRLFKGLIIFSIKTKALNSLHQNDIRDLCRLILCLSSHILPSNVLIGYEMPFKPQCGYHTSHTVSGVDLPSQPFYPWPRRAVDEATSELDSSQDGRQAHGGTVFCFRCQRSRWGFQMPKVMCWVFFQGQQLARGHTVHSPLGLWPGAQVLPLS